MIIIYICICASISLENPEKYMQSCAQGHFSGLEDRGRTAWDTYALGLRGNALFLLLSKSPGLSFFLHCSNNI